MYMIYSFSAQPGEVSSQLSYKVSYKIVETVDYVFDGGHEDWQISQWAEKINFITRKLAHMTEYFALAVAVSFPLYVYGLHGILLMLVAGIICVGFACGDEYHQSFVSGRSPAVKDVLIDSFGVFWGIILVRIVGWTGRKTIFRPKPKKEKVREEKPKKKFSLFGKKSDTQEDYPEQENAPDSPYPPPGYGYGPNPNGYPPNPGYYGPALNRYMPNRGAYGPMYRGRNVKPPEGYYPEEHGYGPGPGAYYPEEHGYGPGPNIYYPEEHEYSENPEGAPVRESEDSPGPDVYYPGDNGYGEPQNGYPPNGYGPNPNGYDTPEPSPKKGKKAKKEKDWIFDDFV